MTPTTAPPMPYSGGKQTLAERIADLLPPHDHYIELFGGALSVLLAKAPTKVETVNDINGDLMTFWRVLRDQPEQLERACALTPHSRAEFLACREQLEVADDIERARRVWVTITQSRGSMLGRKSGWRFVHGTNRMSLAKYLDGYLARIAPAAERLKGVSLECRDAFALIDAYERPGALFYVDPPYLAETRFQSGQYLDEFDSIEQHTRLLERLIASPAAVVISGYAHPLYDDTLTGWSRATFTASAMSGGVRTEVIWSNRPLGGEHLFSVGAS